MRIRSLAARRVAQRGVSLIEIMVAVLIGMVAVLVIFQVFTVSEGFKRNTTGVGDAQQTGLFSTFTLGLELANAGNGIALAGSDLITCTDTGDIATTMRPIPVLITAGASNDIPDSFVVNYSTSRRVVSPVALYTPSVAGALYQVQSPTGFAKDDMIVAISKTGFCVASTIVSVTPPDPATGRVDITHTPMPFNAAQTFPGESPLLNMGPATGVQRVLYDVQNDSLRSTNLFTAGAVASPVASNVINLKAQYGIDTNNDSFVDTWVPATGAWNAPTVLAANLVTLSQIKAIRIGVIVRSEQYDRDITGTTPWTLFDCELANKALCVGRLTGSVPANWRYRTYETVVPLRNQIWNPT